MRAVATRKHVAARSAHAAAPGRADRSAPPAAPLPRLAFADLALESPSGGAIQLKKGRDRCEIRHGGVPFREHEVRRALHRKWKVPAEQAGQAVVGLPRAELGPEEEVSVDERMARLPSAYRHDADIRRLLGEPDAAHARVDRAMGQAAAPAGPPRVTGGRVREVLAAVEFADRAGVPRSEVRSAPEYYDFDIGLHKMDPFEMPRGAFDGFLGDRGAYAKHTQGDKGGSTGILDTTYSHPVDVKRMDRQRIAHKIRRGKRVDVRVPLERELLRDALSVDLRRQRLAAHRGSDPTLKFGYSNASKLAANKARYDARMRKKRGE